MEKAIADQIDEFASRRGAEIADQINRFAQRCRARGDDEVREHGKQLDRLSDKVDDWVASGEVSATPRSRSFC